MEKHCIDSERIAEVLDLGRDHPTRLHVDGCPRCRNLLRSYQKFVGAEPVAGFEAGAARSQLDAWIAAKVSERQTATSPRSPLHLSNLLRGFLRPAPLVAVGAVAVVIAGLVWQQSRESDGILLRDQSVTQSALPPAEVRSDGSIRLTWAAVSGADAYQIRIYGPSFAEIYRHPDVAETSAVIERSSLPADLPPSLDLMWRVYALQAGDTVAVSEPGSIRIR